MRELLTFMESTQGKCSSGVLQTGYKKSALIQGAFKFQTVIKT